MLGALQSESAFVQIAIKPRAERQIGRPCPRCDAPRNFVSSGKFRVNAQGKKIDAWLIFRCENCGRRWNWPIHERQLVGRLDREEFEALSRNDSGLAARYAAIATGRSVDAGSIITRTVRHAATDETRSVVLTTVVTSSAHVRLDRMLALTLSIARGAIHDLQAASALLVLPRAANAMRKSAIDGQEIRLDLSLCPPGIANRVRHDLRTAETRVITS